MNKLGIKFGLAWGIVGTILGAWFVGLPAIGGFILSPFAGLINAQLVPTFSKGNKLTKIFITVLSVVIGFFIFGLGVGIVDALRVILDPPNTSYSSIKPFALLLQDLAIVMASIFYLHLFIIGFLIWPASYYTFETISQKSHQISTT